MVGGAPSAALHVLSPFQVIRMKTPGWGRNHVPKVIRCMSLFMVNTFLSAVTCRDRKNFNSIAITFPFVIRRTLIGQIKIW